MSTTIVSKFDESCPSGRSNRLKQHLLGLLRQGLQPRQLALALALGATIGLLPAVWGTSLLCVLGAALLRVNQLAVQLANYLVFPLQLLLLLPYFRLGGKLFSTQNLPANFDSFLAQLQVNPWAVLGDYWQANLQAIFVWLLTSPLLLAAGFLLGLVLVKRFQ